MGIGILSIVSHFSIRGSIILGVFLCVLSMCVLSSRVCILLGELFVLISSIKVLLIVVCLCVFTLSI